MGKSQVFAGVVGWPGGGNQTPPPGARYGVFRLEADGVQWQQLAGGLPAECHVPCLTVDPHDHARIYAGTDTGPYVSEDGGESWRRLGFPRHDLQVWSIAVHPGDPQRIYVGTSPLGIFRSDDGGASFHETKGVALPDVADMRGFRNRVMRIACNPANPEEMFAGLEVRGVIRSLDGGLTWQDCSAHLIALAEQDHLKSAIITTHTAEGMLDVHALALSPAAPEVPFLALRMGLFCSDDHGAHWTDLEMRRRTPIFYGRDIRVSPHDPRTLFATMSTSAAGEAGTVWRSTDLGENWTRFDPPTEAKATMMAVAPSLSDPAVVYACARKGQVFGTRDGGATWRETPLPEGCSAVLALAVS